MANQLITKLLFSGSTGNAVGTIRLYRGCAPREHVARRGDLYRLQNHTTAPVAVALRLVVGTMSSMADDAPHTMLSSFPPVGVSHRRSLYPQRFTAPQSGRRVVVEFEHTLSPTRSQPTGVWRVMAYDSSSSAVTYVVHTLMYVRITVRGNT